MARLPNDLLRKILGYLDTDDQLRLTKCCSTFASVMPFHELHIDAVATTMPIRNDDMDDAYPVYLSNEEQRRRDVLCKASRYLSLASCRIVRLSHRSWWYDGGLMLSEAFPNLKHLIVETCLPLGHLHYFINLRTLIVDDVGIGNDFDERDLVVLRGLYLFRVKDLSLANFRERVADINLPAREGGMIIPGMRQLCTSRTTKFCNDDAAFISKAFPNIKAITLCNLQGKIWIEWFEVCSGLEILKIIHSKVTLVTNVAVPPLGLRTLCLANLCKVDEFSFLQQLHCLAELVIWCENFTCSDLQKLSSSASLTYLDVSYTKAISDELLEILLARRYPLKHLIANADPGRLERERRPSVFFDVDNWEVPIIFFGHPKSVTWFSTRALMLYLESNPALDVLSVNDHSSINDSVFAKDCSSFKTLHSLRLLGTGCTTFGVTQLCYHRKTAIDGGNTLHTIAVAVDCDLRGFSERLQESFIVLDDSVWASRTESEMMSVLAAKRMMGNMRLKAPYEWSISSGSVDEGDDGWSSGSDGRHAVVEVSDYW